MLLSRKALLAPLGLFAWSACATTIFEGRKEQRADEWTVALTKYKDGPNSWATGGHITYVPADGERFLWIVVTVRNDASTTRLMDFGGCGIDRGDDVALAGIVTHDLFVNTNIGSQENMAPGEELTRKLGISYPKDRWPKTFECAGVKIPLPARD